MAVYSTAQRSTALTTGLASLSIITASSDRASILESGIFLAAATASVFALGRPAASGVTPTAATALQAEDAGAPTASTTYCLAWGTAPTAPTIALRRWSGPATIGTGVIFTFPRGIVIAVSSNYVHHNLAATVAAADHYVVLDE
jgi:hypothetical protein